MASRSALRSATIALVGPTGVGKTTTLAKLAAGCSVVVPTVHAYRIAAFEQLCPYADLLGVHCEVA